MLRYAVLLDLRMVRLWNQFHYLNWFGGNASFGLKKNRKNQSDVCVQLVVVFKSWVDLRCVAGLYNADAFVAFSSAGSSSEISS